jgi:hypothetical protein
MLAMSHDSDLSPPSDVCLLLRAHAEQRWLSLELNPVLRQLQQPDCLPEEQLGAALAYLEVLWIEAAQRAAETDAAYAALEACERATETDADAVCALRESSLEDGGWTLPSKARRYHAAVRTLRDVLGRHVTELLAIPNDTAACKHANS